ncbi:MAG TPA: dCTP deaminase [Bacteroidales bacterium]|nr:dCTP deaminase [Bacteroidales bacterium]HRT38385.1 dCTP deaminase [Rectinema sp.]HRU33990.1 dCTP deaminase [Bacteroidales bacterium]
MSILVDHEIRDLCRDAELISPYYERNINPNSYDITLADDFVWYRKPGLGEPMFIDPFDRKTVELCVVEEKALAIKIGQNEFALGRTVETINLPSNIAAVLMGKSSLARLGITIHQTGGFIDSGFKGTLTLEIGNINPRHIVLHAGMTIGQLVFHKLPNAPDVTYGEKKTSKYQGQIAPTLSRYHMNECIRR